VVTAGGGEACGISSAWLRGRGIVFAGFRPCSGRDARAAVDFLGMPVQAIRMLREGKMSGECGRSARPWFTPGQICVVASSDAAADQTLRWDSPHGVHHDGAAASFKPFGPTEPMPREAR
jgi:hypothetical protein